MGSCLPVDVLAACTSQGPGATEEEGEGEDHFVKRP